MMSVHKDWWSNSYRHCVELHRVRGFDLFFHLRRWNTKFAFCTRARRAKPFATLPRRRTSTLSWWAHEVRAPSGGPSWAPCPTTWSTMPACPSPSVLLLTSKVPELHFQKEAGEVPENITRQKSCEKRPWMDAHQNGSKNAIGLLSKFQTGDPSTVMKFHC